MARTAPQVMRFTILGEWSPIGQIANVIEQTVAPTVGSTREEAALEQAEAISNAWITSILPQIPNNYTHQVVEWVDLHTATGSTGSFAQATATAGGQVGASTPPNIGPLVHKNLVGSARGERDGRMYLPGIQEDDVGEGGLLLVAEINSLNASLAAWLGQINVVSGVGFVDFAELAVVQWPSVEVPQPSKRVPDPDGVGTPRRVDTLTVDPMVGTQRRRLRR